MATLRVRDHYGNEFDIDATARAFWQGREGYQILDDHAGSEASEPAVPTLAEQPGTESRTSRPRKTATE